MSLWSLVMLFSTKPHRMWTVRTEDDALWGLWQIQISHSVVDPA